MKILQPNYIEERNSKFLLIWRDIPYWMVVDEEAKNVITMWNHYKSAESLVSELKPVNTAQRIKIKNQVTQFIKTLRTVGIAYEDDFKPTPAPLEPILENITINVTRKCNLKCKHCFLDRSQLPSDSLNINALKHFLDEGAQWLSKKLNFIILGGEPLLAKEKVLAIAKIGLERNQDVVVSTNGILIDNDFAHKAFLNNLTVQVSLDGATKTSNDSIRGNGSFDKAIQGIQCLVENRVYTIISMVVYEKNFSEMEDFYRLAVSLGVKEVRFIPLKLMGNARTNQLRPIPMLNLIRRIDKITKKYRGSRKFFRRDILSTMKVLCKVSKKRAYCGTGLKTTLIDSDGEIYPCPNHTSPQFSCGNIHKESFNEIWLNSPILNELRNLYYLDGDQHECRSCVVKYWCMGGCRGETFENLKTFNQKTINCKDNFESIIETFWLISNV